MAKREEDAEAEAGEVELADGVEARGAARQRVEGLAVARRVAVGVAEGRRNGGARGEAREVVEAAGASRSYQVTLLNN